MEKFINMKVSAISLVIRCDNTSDVIRRRHLAGACWMMARLYVVSNEACPVLIGVKLVRVASAKRSSHELCSEPAESLCQCHCLRLTNP